MTGADIIKFIQTNRLENVKLDLCEDNKLCFTHRLNKKDDFPQIEYTISPKEKHINYWNWSKDHDRVEPKSISAKRALFLRYPLEVITKEMEKNI